MNYLSTRGGCAPMSIELALAAGLASDGGLYVPERLPTIASVVGKGPLADTSQSVLAPFVHGSSLQSRLGELCAEAYVFDAPLRPLHGAGDYLLELFHGPTAAFKDYGARFLAGSLTRLRTTDAPPTTILVATSGDTGAAVAAAFHRRAGFRVVILYPDGRVSPRQAHGLECWGDNVLTLRVDGNFDDCQRLAKQALADSSLRAQVPLSSANSISLGRLLPQVAYYAHAAGQFFSVHGVPLNFIVPTGNLGNAAAAWMARGMGLPIGDIVLACNANDVLPRYFAGAEFTPRPTHATLANAMDVGAPSNFERLRYWHRDDAELRAAISAHAVDDEAIIETIHQAPSRHGILPCPHTATGLHVLKKLRTYGDVRPWAVVATAHPAKFESIVEPLIGRTLELPPSLAQMLARPASAEPLDVDYASLRARLHSL